MQGRYSSYYTIYLSQWLKYTSLGLNITTEIESGIYVIAAEKLNNRNTIPQN